MVIMLNAVTVKAAGLVSTSMNGSVGYTYRSTTYGYGDNDNQQLIKANIDNSFFIWRDWFLTGHSSLVFAQEQRTYERGESDNFSFTGTLGFSVLPQSSTPFGFSYTRSDSRIDSSFKYFTGSNAASLDDNVVSDAIVLHQSLIGKGYRLKINYSDDSYTSSLRGKYGSNSLGLTGLLRGSTGVLRGSITQRAELTYGGMDRDSQIARFNYNYTGFKQLTINTALSSSKVEQTPDSARVLNNSLSNYSVVLNQASTAIIWRSLNKKVTLTSGLRFSGVTSRINGNASASNGSGSENASLAANLGVVYRYSKNLAFNVNSVRVVNQFAKEESTLAQDRVGVRYRSDEIKLGELVYDWRAGLDLGRREDDGTQSNDTTVDLGHGLGQDWVLAKGQRLYARGGQNYSMTSLADRVRHRLSHRVSLGWKQSLLGINRRMQLQLSDQRDINDESVLQMLSAGLDQQMHLTRRIKLNGSLNYQLTNYQYAGSSGEVSSSDTSVISMSGSLSYLNPFSVAGMVFTSDYKYSQSAVALQDGLGTQQTWNNKLNYRVGKIDVSLQYLYREARKISYNVIYFNVKRVF